MAKFDPLDPRTWNDPEPAPRRGKRRFPQTERALQSLKAAVFFLEQAHVSLTDPNATGEQLPWETQVDDWRADLEHAHEATIAGLHFMMKAATQEDLSSPPPPRPGRRPKDG